MEKGHKDEIALVCPYCGNRQYIKNSKSFLSRCVKLGVTFPCKKCGKGIIPNKHNLSELNESDFGLMERNKEVLRLFGENTYVDIAYSNTPISAFSASPKISRKAPTITSETFKQLVDATLPHILSNMILSVVYSQAFVSTQEYNFKLQDDNSIITMLDILRFLNYFKVSPRRFNKKDCIVQRLENLTDDNWELAHHLAGDQIGDNYINLAKALFPTTISNLLNFVN